MSEALRLIEELESDELLVTSRSEIAAELRRLAAIEAQGVPDAANLVAGALYDFLGYLTSLKKPISLGETEWVAPAVDALVAFADKRRLTLNNPAIEDWFDSLASAPPAPQAKQCEWTNCPTRVGNKCCNEQASVLQQAPVAWKHDCAALLTNDVELWIDACPHCGKPRTHPAQQAKPQPLSAREIWDNDAIMTVNADAQLPFETIERFARAIEAAHGITAQD